MARSQPNRSLAALLREADWNAAELARAVNEGGRLEGLVLRYDRTSIAHWLTGSRPRPPVPDLVAAAFSRRLGRLVAAGDTGLARPRRTLGEPAPTVGTEPDDAVHRLTVLIRADVDPVRRVPLVDSVYTLPADAGVPPVREPRRAGRARSRGTRTRVTAEDIGMLREMSRLFADLMDRHGGAHARSALIAYLGDDISRLLVASAGSASRRELLTATAQLTHQLARMTMDAGHPGLAQRYFTVALGLAREADDCRLYAITLRAMSLQALHLGLHQQAWQLADTAVRTAGPSTDPATLAFLLSQRAVTCAYTRQRRQAVRDLVTAEARHERATSPPGPFTSYPRPGLDFQRGLALHALGDSVLAVHALAASVAARPADRHRAGALTHARLAATLLPLGRLEESCHHWHAFLDHYPYLRLAPADRALWHLRESLHGFRRQPQAAAVLHRARAAPRAKTGPSGGRGPV
ncbi:hypothetical protein [Streptomyces sp. NPDC058953]|uniref:hypothetical protein n=1 Tax=unclassified Streptomyces TaxID=2593676 RepID=UPI0036AAD3F0